MKTIALIAALGLPFAAQAGGLERANQDISAIFANGNYGEFSYAYVMPDVQGQFMYQVQPGVVVPLKSGNMAMSYGQLAGAVKFDINDDLSLALIGDQPYGASVEYKDANYPLTGTQVNINSYGLTALARYKIGNGLSVHGGLSMVSTDANVAIVNGGTPQYQANMKGTRGFGYVVGAAYERPEIALRAALTYRSDIDMAHDTQVFGVYNIAEGTKYTLPRSLTLDLQTGIAADTLLMGQIRWVDWSELSIAGPNPANPAAPVPLVSDMTDSVTYSVGLGRKFTEQLSGSVMFSYEASDGKLASNLYPTDGKFAVTLGAKYEMAAGTAISFGANYTVVGDTTTELLNSKFANNSALGFGIKYSFNF